MTDTEFGLRSGGSDAQVLRLHDARALGYAEQGDPAGTPVLFFHGLAGSRLSRHSDGSIADGLGIRLISFDRPGIGLSTPQRNGGSSTGRATSRSSPTRSGSNGSR